MAPQSFPVTSQAEERELKRELEIAVKQHKKLTFKI